MKNYARQTLMLQKLVDITGTVNRIELKINSLK